MSNASEDFPEPDNPVITTNLSLGIATSIFFKLCCLAPFRVMNFLDSKDKYSYIKVDFFIDSLKLTNLKQYQFIIIL